MSNLIQTKDSLDIRRKNDLMQAFVNADNIINKSYLTVLTELEIVPPSQEIINIDIASKARFIKINKLVYNKNENNLDKLTTIINSVSLAGGSIATIIKSNGKVIDYYLGVINKDDRNDLTVQLDILEGTFNGNFSGSEINLLSNSKFKNLTEDIFADCEDDEEKVITSVSGVASLRLEEGKEIENYIQGLEKLADSVKGMNYTAVLLADPVSNKQVVTMRAGYENLYSQLVPFLKTELSFNENDTLTLTEGSTSGITKTINNSISYTQSYSETNGWSKSDSVGNAKTTNNGGVVSSVVATAGGIIGTFVGGPLGTIAGGTIGGMIGGVAGGLIGSDTTNSNTTTSDNHNTAKSNGESTQTGESEAGSEQINKATSEATSRGRNIQISYENRGVKTLIEKIDKQIERLKECEDFGTFSFAAYFISNDASVNKIAASSYNGLMRGKNSSVESSHINTWYDSLDNKKLCKYLGKLTHPLFELNLSEHENVKVSPASIVSGQELSIHLALPKKSIAGLPVIEAVEFGRNIFSLSKDKTINGVRLGKVYHMGKCEDTDVMLDKKSLSMHTFITGSTGAGKSNTIYKMLDELNNKNVKFLVIEPAKGEYKHVFGHRKDVTVLGTNHYKTKLLKINPFKFAKGVHVLEHIDRLIEIFNVCWPMYAAMPAVLKEAVEKSYEAAGWDLDMSENKYNENLYPAFADILVKLNDVIKESAFSEEVKGNYIGSLVTRVKSLTNGINGRIFSSDEIDNEILFDTNVIVDLSRVGSVETKSMIMGILIMRLQEHRMTQGGMNKPLRHVTVLEEAHNILKRTSTEQSSDGSNLVGKSVEMLANSIAEIRTYGEGFIIADQSPGMLDMSAIRNTNTKIILRLPDLSDRELVGKASGLTDEQIVELSKLETGVAAIYQNDWLEPVLCKVDKYKIEFEEKEFIEKQVLSSDNGKTLKAEISRILLADHIGEKVDYNIDKLTQEILKAKYTLELKINILHEINSKKSKELKNISGIISKLYSNDEAFKIGKEAKNFDDWNEVVLDNIDQTVFDVEEEYRNSILQCLLREKAVEQKEMEEFYFKWTDYMRGKVQ